MAANDYSFEHRSGNSFLEDGARVVSVIGAITLGRIHDGKTLRLDKAAGLAVTLPAARGSGTKYRLVVGTVLSSGNYTVAVPNATDYMRGQAWMCNDSDASVSGFETANTGTPSSETDTVTLNGSTKGGAVGDVIELEDIATNVWQLSCKLTGTGSETSPLSAAV